MVLFENLQVFRAHGLLHDDRFLELWIVWMKCEKERWVSILRIFCSYPFRFLLLFISLPLEKSFFHYLKPSPNVLKFIMSLKIFHKKGHMRVC
jgi:hypothetical protein